MHRTPSPHNIRKCYNAPMRINAHTLLKRNIEQYDGFSGNIRSCGIILFPDSYYTYGGGVLTVERGVGVSFISSPQVVHN